MTKPKYDPEFLENYNEWKEGKERYMRNKEKGLFGKKEKSPKKELTADDQIKRAERIKKIIGVLGFGGVLICGAGLYATGETGGFLTAMMIAGLIAFLPMGLFIGLYLGDQYRMTSFLRSITRKNYGRVNFVAPDGKNILWSKMVDMNSDVLDSKEGVWRIDRTRIFNDKGGITYPIDENMIKHKAGVPSIFIEAQSFRPLNFLKDETNLDSEQLTATLRAHLVNLASRILSKNSRNIFIICAIAAGAACISALMGFAILDMLQNNPACISAVQAAGNVVTQGG